MTLGSQDKFFLATSFGTALVGAGLMVGGFVLRFGRGFGTFANYAKADNDFLELGRLDIVFGLFTAAAGVLILSFFLALVATLKKNKFLLKTYCAVIALMIVVQLVAGLLGFQYSDSVKVLASDDTLRQKIQDATLVLTNNGGKVTNDNNVAFWTHTQQQFTCCGVTNYQDWGVYSASNATLFSLNCYVKNYNTGCDKQITNRISQDSQYLAVASMGVLLVEMIACFLAGYRAYHLKYDD